MDMQSFINQWIDGHRDDLVRDIGRLVAVKSVRGEAAPGAPFGPGPQAALNEALALCGDLGFAVKNYDGYVGTADLCALPTAVDILGHLDVVGEGEGWDTDPYRAVEKDGLLFGRGTDDDKGPLVAALYAMAAVKASGAPLAANTRLIMGTDEESGMGDLPHYYAQVAPAPNTFSPDATFPVYNTEKGGYRPTMTKAWPVSDALPRLSAFDGGFRFNVLPADANATVLGLDAQTALELGAAAAEKLGVSYRTQPVPGGAKLLVTGKGSHAAYPEGGNNGITALISILLALPLAECGSTLALRQLSELLPHGDCYGTALGIRQEDPVSGRLTLSFTLLKMDETGLEGGFDSRVPICATHENCQARAEAAFAACGIALSGEMEACHHTPSDSPFVQTLLRCYERCTGQAGACLAMGGGTYVHHVQGGVAFGAGMPGFDSFLHSPNERISIENTLTAAKIYANVIWELCGA